MSNNNNAGWPSKIGNPSGTGRDNNPQKNNFKFNSEVPHFLGGDFLRT